MNWEAVGALASLASTFVVAVAAIAAVLQIRHLHDGNQLDAILRIYERFDSAEMIAARAYCQDELPRLIADPVSRSAIARGNFDPRLTLVTAFYTEIGAFVVDGFLEERIVGRLGPVIARAWTCMEPLARDIRKRREEPVWAGFEYIAALQERQTRATRLQRYPAWFRARVAASISADVPSVEP